MQLARGSFDDHGTHALKGCGSHGAGSRYARGIGHPRTHSPIRRAARPMIGESECSVLGASAVRAWNRLAARSMITVRVRSVAVSMALDPGMPAASVGSALADRKAASPSLPTGRLATAVQVRSLGGVLTAPDPGLLAASVGSALAGQRAPAPSVLTGRLATAAPVRSLDAALAAPVALSACMFGGRLVR